MTDIEFHKIVSVNKDCIFSFACYFLQSREDAEDVTVVILSIDRKEAAFVNIVGTMDFESMGKLSKKFEIPQLDSLKSK